MQDHKPKPAIWTIGHSTRGLAELVDMLKENEVDILIDVRSFPGSRRHPHFNKESLTRSIPAAGIEYTHMVDLGGRRKTHAGSPNTTWKNPSFRGYADYMETDRFAESVRRLETLAAECRACYMCSEAVWWRCHRSMLSDHFMSRGWVVNHIMGGSSVAPHRYTKPARIVDGVLTYHEASGLFADIPSIN